MNNHKAHYPSKTIPMFREHLLNERMQRRNADVYCINELVFCREIHWHQVEMRIQHDCTRIT